MPTRLFCAHCNHFVGHVDCPDPGQIGPHKLLVGPLVAVDAIVEYRGRILLVYRAKADDAEAGKWALPGGYVNYRERTRDAAVRETLEETGLELTSVELFGVYDDPRRDMFDDRNNVSVVYTGVGIGELRAADRDGEVSAVRGFSREEIEDQQFSPLGRDGLRSYLAVPQGTDPTRFTCGRFDIAFDHARILSDYFARSSRR